MMYRSRAFTTFSLLAISVALIVPRATQPIGWSKNLESWSTYHARYLAWGCESEHHTSFFDQCCHPLLASETLADLPAQCNDDDEDCDDTPDAKATPAPAPVTNNVVTGGFVTYFYQKGNAGACGVTHTDQALIAAMDQGRYNSGLCGKKVSITNHDTQKTVVVTIADDCPTCRNKNSIDLSVYAFQQLSDLGVGLLKNITWFYID